MKSQQNRRILIVGEGRETEYNYFVGLRKTNAAKLAATATSMKPFRGAGRNARSIVENAINVKKRETPDRRRGDQIFLLMDTEGATREPELPEAEKLAKKNGIEIVYSCPSFEYWLLCHFDQTPRKYFKDCDAVIAEVNKDKRWNSVCNSAYDKGDQDIFDRLESSLSLARSQSLKTDLHNLRTQSSIVRMNPSTQVYDLIAVLIGVQSGEPCPITGTWTLVGENGVTSNLNKGDTMPEHNSGKTHWKIEKLYPG